VKNLEIQTIKVKRQVKINTVVTENFKEQTLKEFSNEVELLNTQIFNLEMQLKQFQEQNSGFSQIYGVNSSLQASQMINEISLHLQQLVELKNELLLQQENIKNTETESIITTGILENEVELSAGDEIYVKFNSAQILVKDGIIEKIIG